MLRLKEDAARSTLPTQVMLTRDPASISNVRIQPRPDQLIVVEKLSVCSSICIRSQV